MSARDLNLPKSYDEVVLRMKRFQGTREAEDLNWRGTGRPLRLTVVFLSTAQHVTSGHRTIGPVPCSFVPRQTLQRHESLRCQTHQEHRPPPAATAAGKTTLAETMLFEAGSSTGADGRVEEGNTVSDFHPIEHERGSSAPQLPAHRVAQLQDRNIIDTPGLDDLVVRPSRPARGRHLCVAAERPPWRGSGQRPDLRDACSTMTGR